MPDLRIYIWEGGWISDAYHNDGTLVVLAESPEQARHLVREKVAAANPAYAAWLATDRSGPRPHLWSQPWDGDEAALDRAPDRVIDVVAPTWVAFNGGGYD